MKNKKKLLIPLILALFGLFVFGTTYAFFSANVTSVNKTDTVLKAQSLTLTFRGQNEVVNCSNIVPGDKCIKTFEVENTSSVETFYNIYMEDVENGFNSDLVYTLKEGNTEVIAETVTPETNDGKTYIKTGVTIPGNTTKSYTLTIEFKHTDSDQNINQGKEFKTTVGIDTTQIDGVVKVISGGKINASNITDGTSVTKTFKIKNLANVTRLYDVALSDVVNTYANGLQFSLTKNGTQVIATRAMPTEDTTILENQKINANVTDTYVMTISYDSSISMEEGYKLLANEANVFSTNITLDTKQYLAKKCVRADTSTLHTETCKQSSNYCKHYVANGATITYGNQTTTPGELHTGDAFDCDIDGNDRYDPETERFYYVSTMDNGATSDSNTAVLIYYKSNVATLTSWITQNDYTAAGGTNWSNASSEKGPLTAIKNLPTINDWPNMRLTNTTRNLTYAIVGGGKVFVPGFQYKKNDVDLAARLLTYQEVYNGCYKNDGNAMNAMWSLSNCVFLFENTTFAKDNITNSLGYWLENPAGSNGKGGSVATGAIYTDLSTSTGVSTGNSYTARPAIEVAKTDIEY